LAAREAAEPKRQRMKREMDAVFMAGRMPLRAAPFLKHLI
jgi:hypothetical protein